MSERHHMNRRVFFQGSAGAALAAGGLALPARQAVAQDQVTIRWWEHFPEGLNQTIRDSYMEAHPDVTIELTGYPPNEMNQALQLAYQSNQMPDITTTPGAAGTSIENLIREGWFQPLPNREAIRSAMPEGSLQQGLTIFDDQVYSFPIFSPRQYTTLTWFNRQMMEAAGVDPNVGPATWDEFRQAAAAITENGGGQAYGWIQGINFPDRMAVHVTELAQSAGAPGPIDFATGEYAHGTEPFLQAMEFLLSMHQDGLLFPSSLSLDAREARARWASGGGGMFFDGPWNVGVVKADFEPFLENVGVAPIPVPEAGSTPRINAGPPGGTFWVAAQSEHPDVAADILLQMTTDEYYVTLAERMDQPPFDLSAVERAEVHPTYAQAMTFFADQVRLAPAPVTANPAVADVIAEMQPIEPNLGQIIIGTLTGDVEDYAAAFQEYAAKLTAERDRAIGVVQSSGADISIEAWVFPDWDPDQDYVPAQATPAASR